MTGSAALVLLAAHAAATLVMVGVIWYVQLVHYPLMRDFGQALAGEFPAFERLHQARTTLVVAPTMLIEAGCATALAAGFVSGVSPLLAWLGLGFLVVVWISTFAVQVPLHKRLETGFDLGVARALVRTNWVRTALWSVRGVLALLVLAHADPAFPGAVP